MKISAATFNLEVSIYELKLFDKALFSILGEYTSNNPRKPYDRDYNYMVDLRNQINNFLKENDNGVFP
jgi:hypothetical protein